jgi:Uma2 family endonuclease
LIINALDIGKIFLHIIYYKNYLYPDVFVVENQPIFDDEHRDIVTNPILIVEVLSEGTEAFDRGDKFLSYQKIETLREYILVSQDKHRVEQYILNQKGKWQQEEVLSDGVLQFKCLPFELPLDDIYLNVTLTPNT